MGAAVALVIGQRDVIAGEVAAFDRRRAAVLALSFLPALAAGVLLERPIERRLGGPGATAAGLVAGSMAMVLGRHAHRSCAGTVTRERSTASRWGSARRRRWPRASRATAQR